MFASVDGLGDVEHAISVQLELKAPSIASQGRVPRASSQSPAQELHLAVVLSCFYGSVGASRVASWRSVTKSRSPSASEESLPTTTLSLIRRLTTILVQRKLVPLFSRSDTDLIDCHNDWI